MDAVAEWVRAQSRVIELVQTLSATDAEARVPACPAWTVRELLAHVVGLDADVLAGDEPDDHNSTWTQRQVDARAGDDITTIVAEWRAMTEPMQEWMRENGTRPLGDVVIHEQDLRGATNVPGARDTDGLAALRDRMAGRLADRVRVAGLPAVALDAPTWSFTTGPGAPGVTLRAPQFDLTRALMARRTADQLRRWTTEGDIEPYLPLFGGLGPLPDAELPE